MIPIIGIAPAPRRHGLAMGCEEFVSFDRQAVRLLAAAGHRARLLA